VPCTLYCLGSGSFSQFLSVSNAFMSNLVPMAYINLYILLVFEG